ncbi:RPS21, partial [Symbiodinium microadriaticum]
EHGAVQLNVGQVDENGMYTGEFETFALAGFIRARGESDACCNEATSASEAPQAHLPYGELQKIRDRK